MNSHRSGKQGAAPHAADSLITDSLVPAPFRAQLIDSDARLTVATLGPGALAGEMGFVDGTRYQSSLVALGSARVLALMRTDLESLLSTHPSIVYHVMRAIIRTIHVVQRRLSQQAVELSNYIYKQHGRY